jgi:hypothetical protein
MNKWHNIVFFTVVALLGTTARAQQPGAQASLGSDTALIGDQLCLSLELTVPDGSKVTWPVFEDTLVRGVEILRRTGVDTLAKEGGQFTLKQELLITSFDSGNYAIPPVPFRFLELRDTTKYYTETRPLKLYVKSPDIDPAGDIKTIKPPLKAPVTFAEIAPWLGGAAFLLLAGLGLWYYLQRRKKEEPVFRIRQKPKLPPHQIALEALETLKQKKLWQAGRVKEYYTELTDIVRVYIEDRFGIMAMEMTTDEIMAALKGTGVPDSHRGKLYSTLAEADLVKFAKSRPLPDENDANFHHCVDFVRQTRPAEDLRSPEEKVVTTVEELKS